VIDLEESPRRTTPAVFGDESAATVVAADFKPGLEVRVNKLRSLGVAAVFLAGCAVGGASSRFVVPPASAQQQGKAVAPPPGATRWEQMCIKTEGDIHDISTTAMDHGDAYWEFVSSSVFPAGVMLCFKRLKA